MSIVHPRVIYYDDDHPAIEYGGIWEQSEEAFLNDKSPVFGGKQQMTKGEASLSFEFTGTEFRMLGRLVPVPQQGQGSNATSLNTRPSWQCFMDGEEFAGDTPEDKPANGFTYCYWRLEESEADDINHTHTFHMRINADEDAPLWIDAVYVLPPALETVQSRLKESDGTIWARLTPKDASVRLGPNWGSLDTGDVRYTVDEGSFVDIDFIGTQVVWWGSSLLEMPVGTSRGSYSIDGGPNVSFPFTGRRRPGIDPGYRQFFETETFGAGLHTLRVTYDGFEAPLVFNQVFIKDGDIFEPDPRTLSDSDRSSVRPRPPQSSADPSGLPSDIQARPVPVGAIVGAVVGCVAMILGVVLVLMFFRAKRREVLEEEATQSRLREFLLNHPNNADPGVDGNGGVTDSSASSTTQVLIATPNSFGAGMLFVKSRENLLGDDQRGSTLRSDGPSDGGGAQRNVTRVYAKQRLSQSRVSVEQDSDERRALLDRPPSYSQGQ
ncbi:hypothetical protein FA15DRAFT_655359 [Coprinopsis marcescibilis]|uniref:Uncharacterized protein n=1 Tax=Coprinopsis marcescibilis TaxID=230819 RepID=A0A5C3KXB5_COPMA|nr:hypothetical protein FA15DRAFT_655359 [Coprinopsis marcescibilis]